MADNFKDNLLYGIPESDVDQTAFNKLLPYPETLLKCCFVENYLTQSA